MGDISGDVSNLPQSNALIYWEQPKPSTGRFKEFYNQKMWGLESLTAFIITPTLSLPIFRSQKTC
jgi:hypothetical protein